MTSALVQSIDYNIVSLSTLHFPGLHRTLNKLSREVAKVIQYTLYTLQNSILTQYCHSVHWTYHAIVYTRHQIGSKYQYPINIANTVRCQDSEFSHQYCQSLHLMSCRPLSMLPRSTSYASENPSLCWNWTFLARKRSFRCVSCSKWSLF